MYAIIEINNQQLLIKKDNTIFIDKIAGDVGDKVIFDKVLVFNEKVGEPLVSNISITGIIEKQGKQKKLVVYRHNPKSTFKRKLGHRQEYTRIKIVELKESKVTKLKESKTKGVK